MKGDFGAEGRKLLISLGWGAWLGEGVSLRVPVRYES